MAAYSLLNHSSSKHGDNPSFSVIACNRLYASLSSGSYSARKASILAPHVFAAFPKRSTAANVAHDASIEVQPVPTAATERAPTAIAAATARAMRGPRKGGSKKKREQVRIRPNCLRRSAVSRDCPDGLPPVITRKFLGFLDICRLGHPSEDRSQCTYHPNHRHDVACRTIKAFVLCTKLFRWFLLEHHNFLFIGFDLGSPGR